MQKSQERQGIGPNRCENKFLGLICGWNGIPERPIWRITTREKFTWVLHFCIFHILMEIWLFGLQILKFFEKMFFMRNQILSSFEVFRGPESFGINAKNTKNHEKWAILT